MKISFNVGNEVNLNYLMLIVEAMIKEFSISNEEAIGRLNNHWSQYESPFDDDLLFDESPKNWAYIMYYGYDSEWWNKSKDELVPKEYNP